MKNIILIGFMGTGKTSVGRLLAARLGRSFVDIDLKIEQENGMTISEMFAAHGEEYFRQKEQETIAKVSKYTNSVIATGGGAVLFPENITRLKSNGIIISLTASVEAILERTGRRATRPLLAGSEREQKICKLLEERAELYKKADLNIDSSDISPQEVVEKIIDFLRQGGYLRGRS